MALSALGLLQQGLNTLRGVPGQGLAGQNTLTGQAGEENPAGHSARSVINDQVDIPQNLLGESGDQTSQAGALTPAEAAQGLLATALDAIVGTLAEVFERLGNSKDAALEFAQNLVNSIKAAASNADEFTFSFEQAVATSSRSAISYAGADGTAAGVSEQTYLAVQSLDIYVNNNTGELSFNFASVQAEVTRTTAVAHSSSAAGANSLLGKVLQGLEGGSYLTGGEGLALAQNGRGLGSLIREIVHNPPRTNADDDADLMKKLPGAGPLLTIREVEKIIPKGIGDDPVTRIRADLLVPLGQLFNGPSGPEIEGRDGVRQLLLDTFSDAQPHIGLDA